MSAIIKLFKKDLTNGEEAVGGVAPTGEGGAGRNSREPQIEQVPPRPASADKPLTSVAMAEKFARRFLQWCANVGIVGKIDWPRLYVLSQEFAEGEGLQYFSRMALSKALSLLGVRKTIRDIATHERGLVSGKKRDANRPRVTVYILGREICKNEDGAQLKLSD